MLFRSVLRLKLTSGEGYSYSKEKFTQIDFEVMFINDTMQTSLIKYETPTEYWFSKTASKKKNRMLMTDILLSLFPILSLFLVASIGIMHVRHQKGKVYLFIFLTVLIYHSIALGLSGALTPFTIPVVIISWLIITYIIYKKYIVSKF